MPIWTGLELSDIPPIAPKGVATTYHSVFSRCSIPSPYTPHVHPYRTKICHLQCFATTLACKANKGGVSQIKPPSEGYRAIGGDRSYSIAVSRYSATLSTLAHQNRTIATASDFRVDRAKSPQIPQKEGPGFGLSDRKSKSQIASDFPSHP